MMRTLEQALIEHELITLRVIGEWWELDLSGKDKVACAAALAQTLSNLDLTLELKFLQADEAAAVEELVSAGGRMPVAAFGRQHGEVRLMGPGRLEREEPWFDPASPAEALWYRGLIFRGFDESDEAMVEFYFIPEELLAKLPRPNQANAAPAGSLAAVSPPDSYREVVTNLVDDLTTLFVLAHREGLQASPSDQVRAFLQDEHPDRLTLLLRLALENRFLRQTEEGLKPARRAVDWLQQSREFQLRELAEAWKGSAWNDLCHTPELACEGSGWSNDPLEARKVLLTALQRDEKWYPFQGIVSAIKETNPDFQRPDGNYDIWYIRDLASDAYVTGFVNWDLVEGRLLRFLITGPLAWLGMVEAGEDRFRLTSRGLAWLEDKTPEQEELHIPLIVQADASVIVPANASRYQRFQTARIAELAPFTAGQPYQYRITPGSLERAKAQGITPSRVLEFLTKAGGRQPPDSVKRAIERWDSKGLEGRIEPTVILRVQDAGIIDKLQSDQRTRQFLEERLGDLAVVIRSDSWRDFQSAAARLGLLLDSEAK